MDGITIFPSETKTPRTGYTVIRDTSAAGHEGGQRRQNPTWYHRLPATSRSLALLSLLSMDKEKIKNAGMAIAL